MAIRYKKHKEPQRLSSLHTTCPNTLKRLANYAGRFALSEAIPLHSSQESWEEWISAADNTLLETIGLNLELVRETKGTTILENLQHPNEKRKIVCAQKHFASLGVSYRHMTNDALDWYEEENRLDEDNNRLLNQ